MTRELLFLMSAAQAAPDERTGIVGAGGIAPPLPGHDELFSIYAESGMRPDDFVPETAQKYAAYLKEPAQMER